MHALRAAELTFCLFPASAGASKAVRCNLGKELFMPVSGVFKRYVPTMLA